MKGEDHNNASMGSLRPYFLYTPVTSTDWRNLMISPKRWLMYRALKKHFKHVQISRNVHADPYRVLVIGIEHETALVDIKKLFGRSCEVVGLGTVQLHIDVAKKHIKSHDTTADLHWYEGGQFPFSDNIFDAVYSCNVFEKTDNVPLWLDEIYRVLKPDGVCALGANSLPGKYAFISSALGKAGLDLNPLKQSLYTKTDIIDFFEDTGLTMQRMYALHLIPFFTDPECLHVPFAHYQGWKLKLVKMLNSLFRFIARSIPASVKRAFGAWRLLLIRLFGRHIDGQGYVVLAKKQD